MAFKTDILIIGAGAVGVAIARELSKYNIQILVCDKNGDVGGDASRSCSSCISTEATVTPNTLESKICQASRPLFDKLCQDLDIPFTVCGSITPAVNMEQYQSLPSLLKRAFDNGVYDAEFRSREELLEMEPSLSRELLGGIYNPRDAQINQFLLVIAQAENAAENGVDFLLDCEAEDIVVESGKIVQVKTTKGNIYTQYVINAAGLYCDSIANMVGERDFKVNPRRGEFFILGKDTPVKVSHIIFSVPQPNTHGTLVVPTVDGNILIGPTADDIQDKEDKRTTYNGLSEVEEKAKLLVPDLCFDDTITQFVGLRPRRLPEGYNICMPSSVRGYVGISGIRSTGLTGSLGIAKYTVRLIIDSGLSLNRRKDFISHRKNIVSFNISTDELKDQLIENDPLYGHIVCRCEMITESEILQAIHRPVGARTVDAIKRRVRAGMGRCQGGFCQSRIIEILARELKTDAETIRKQNRGSHMLVYQR